MAAVMTFHYSTDIKTEKIEKSPFEIVRIAQISIKRNVCISKPTVLISTSYVLVPSKMISTPVTNFLIKSNQQLILFNFSDLLLLSVAKLQKK